MKKLKLIHNFSSLMPQIEKKWLKVKENSLIKDVKKSFNWKKKYVKEMINHLLLLMKKESIQSVYKLLLIKVSLLLEELKEETCKELF